MTRKIKNIQSVNELSTSVDGILGSLSDTFEACKATIAHQDGIILKAKAAIELATNEADKAKVLAKRLGATLL